MTTRQQKLADIETKMNRWMARSMRASNAIRKLQKQRHRLLKAPTKFEPLAELVQAVDDRLTQVIEARPQIETNDDLTIPPELNRADPLIAERMTAARKKAEEAARHAMPLTGKAAEDYIKAPRKRKA